MLARRPSGFTLVELMVAIVISGILVGVIFQFLLGQTRFARLQSAREEVQQNARVALDVISSDLRAIGPQGIIAASANAITYRAPRAWGVVCGYSGGSLALVFPGPAAPMLKAGSDSLAVGSNFHQVSDVTGDGSGAAAACNAGVAPNPAITAAEGRARLYNLPAGAPTYLRRQDAYVYDRLTYDIGTSAAVPGATWIRRNPGSGAQPLAGPLPANGGLVFAYEDGNGATTADPNAMRRIKVTVTTNSRARFKDQAQADTDSTIIYLRNR